MKPDQGRASFDMGHEPAIETDTVSGDKVNILVVETDIPRCPVDDRGGMKNEGVLESAGGKQQGR
jgi:hypothetical protein